MNKNIVYTLIISFFIVLIAVSISYVTEVHSDSSRTIIEIFETRKKDLTYDDSVINLLSHMDGRGYSSVRYNVTDFYEHLQSEIEQPKFKLVRHLIKIGLIENLEEYINVLSSIVEANLEYEEFHNYQRVQYNQ